MALRSPKLTKYGVVHPAESRMSKMVAGVRPAKMSPDESAAMNAHVQRLGEVAANPPKGSMDPFNEKTPEYPGDPLPPRQYPGPPL